MYFISVFVSYFISFVFHFCEPYFLLIIFVLLQLQIEVSSVRNGRSYSIASGGDVLWLHLGGGMNLVAC